MGLSKLKSAHENREKPDDEKRRLHCIRYSATDLKRSRAAGIFERKIAGKIFVFCVVFSLFSALETSSHRTKKGATHCTFPLAWRGTWFQSQVRGLISISHSQISTKGRCVAQEGDKYLIENRERRGCFICLVITIKHPNVLQYKESHSPGQPRECPRGGRTPETLPSVCRLILGDAPLYSMFKETSSAIPCPFKPPYRYSYDDGYRVCNNPDSRLDACADDRKLVFRQRPCHERDSNESEDHYLATSVDFSLSYDREFTCIGKWSEGRTYYLVGKFSSSVGNKEEMYRCMAYERRGQKINVAMSADATCRGLISPTEGPLNLQLSPEKPASTECQFPSWLKWAAWRDLAATRIFQTDASNSTMRILNITTGKTETYIRCHHRRAKSTAERVELVVHTIVGCNQGYQCVRISRRGTQIVEMLSGSLSQKPHESCHKKHMHAATSTILIGAIHSPSSCPLSGLFDLSDSSSSSSVDVDGGEARFWPATTNCLQAEASVTMAASCEERTKIKVSSSCLSARMERMNEITCLGHWMEDDITFLIAKSDTEVQPYCYALTNRYDSNRGIFLTHVTRQPECRGGGGGRSGSRRSGHSRARTSASTAIQSSSSSSSSATEFLFTYSLARKGSCSHPSSSSESSAASSASSSSSASFSSLRRRTFGAVVVIIAASRRHFATR